MGAGSLRKVKSQLGGCTGGCCSLGAGTLCLQCCGHSEHPALLPKELSSELAVLHQGEATAAARDSAHPAPCHIALRTAGVKSTKMQPADTDTPPQHSPAANLPSPPALGQTPADAPGGIWIKLLTRLWSLLGKTFSTSSILLSQVRTTHGIIHWSGTMPWSWGQKSLPVASLCAIPVPAGICILLENIFLTASVDGPESPRTSPRSSWAERLAQQRHGQRACLGRAAQPCQGYLQNHHI